MIEKLTSKKVIKKFVDNGEVFRSLTVGAVMGILNGLEHGVQSGVLTGAGGGVGTALLSMIKLVNQMKKELKNGTPASDLLKANISINSSSEKKFK